MATKSNSNLTANRKAKAEAEELDSLNAQLRRKGNAVRVMEASIETRTKKRRRGETPKSFD